MDRIILDRLKANHFDFNHFDSIFGAMKCAK